MKRRIQKNRLKKYFVVFLRLATANLVLVLSWNVFWLFLSLINNFLFYVPLFWQSVPSMIYEDWCGAFWIYKFLEAFFWRNYFKISYSSSFESIWIKFDFAGGQGFFLPKFDFNKFWGQILVESPPAKSNVIGVNQKYRRKFKEISRCKIFCCIFQTSYREPPFGVVLKYILIISISDSLSNNVLFCVFLFRQSV